MSTSNNAAFNAVFFSTNLSTFGLQSITELYFKETHCKNLSQKKKNFQVKFIRKLNENKFSFETFGTFYEQNYVYDNPKILEEVDCYIIIFDLEFNDSLVELNKITGFLSDKCDGEKNIYLITIYKNQNDIKKDLGKQNISNKPIKIKNFLNMTCKSPIGNAGDVYKYNVIANSKVLEIRDLRKDNNFFGNNKLSTSYNLNNNDNYLNQDIIRNSFNFNKYRNKKLRDIYNYMNNC